MHAKACCEGFVKAWGGLGNACEGLGKAWEGLGRLGKAWRGSGKAREAQERLGEKISADCIADKDIKVLLG